MQLACSVSRFGGALGDGGCTGQVDRERVRWLHCFSAAPQGVQGLQGLWFVRSAVLQLHASHKELLPALLLSCCAVLSRAVQCGFGAGGC